MYADIYKDTFGYKVFDCTANNQNSKVNQLITLLQDSEVQSFLKGFVDNAIATSELRILKRLAAVEQILGLDDYGQDETAASTLPQRIKNIEDKVNNSITSFKSPLGPKIQPTTKTEIRAVSLVDHLKDTGKDHLTSHEIINFLKCKLPDNCKINENVQNIRKIKQDVLKKAAVIYPNVFLSKKSTGHREVRLVLGS